MSFFPGFFAAFGALAVAGVLDAFFVVEQETTKKKDAKNITLREIFFKMFGV